jgi:hypothetical protein
MSGLSRYGKLKFNPEFPDAYCSDNLGVYLRDGYGLQLTSTLVDLDTQALDVYLHGFDQTISNEDGYLYVDFTNDLLNQDGYLQVITATDKAEDTPHVSGDLGSFVLAVRNDTDTSLVDANGDYAPFQVNNVGRLKVDMDWSDNVPLNDDGYLIVDVRGTLITVDTQFETEIVDCPLTDGYSGTQSFIADSFRRLWVNTSSAVAGSTATASVADTAALLVAGLSGRTRMILQNKGDSTAYIGFANTVTADDNATTGGFELLCGDSLSLEISECIDLYAITLSGETTKIKIIQLG